MSQHNPFSDLMRDDRWLYGIVGVVAAVTAGWMLGGFGLVGGLIALAIPLGLAVVVGILLQPRLGLLIYVNISFMLGLSRFLETDAAVGLALDGLMALTLLGIVLNGKRMAWHRLNNPTFYLLVIWLVYTLLEYFNPDAPSQEGWIYHIRATSMNWFLLALIVFVIPIPRQDIYRLLGIWLCWSVLAAFWGFKQQYIGLEPAEQRWLAEGAEKTHILWGQLRSFSFYSDAGQFGSEMAGVTLLCIIFFFETKRWMYRIGFVLIGVVVFWGFAVAGTRSALFAILGGFPVYLVLMRKPLPILRGIAVAVPLLLILMFTHIGDSNYQIYRMRTALHPMEDASFIVRLENQAKLRAFLKDLPFGAGIGSSTGAGQRFSPNHFASQIPTDSWYVQIWIETGIVGLSLYLFMIAGIMLTGTLKIWQLRDPKLQLLLVALLAEFAGIALVSYSNPILGQFPTSTLLFINSVLFSTGERWDTPPPGQATPPVAHQTSAYASV